MSGPDLSGKYADVVPKPASSVLLVRDGASGLEVFMVTRHHKIDFASGAMVFPGGKVDPADSDADARAACIHADALDDRELAFRVSTIREAFEETGVLLATDRDGGVLPEARCRDLKEKYALAVEKGEITIGALASREGLRFDPGALTPFAYWITPAVLAKRFDTPFYIVEVPEQQRELAEHDGGEAVESVWIDPSEAVRQADAGKVTMVFATRLNLIKLAKAASVAEALAQAAAETPIPVTPRVYAEDGRRKIDIPIEAGFGGPTFDVGKA
jgi:8-oxo-dGTP pyrophosphatase MutT (NUDIX family)